MDSRAFAQFYRKYFDKIYRFVFFRVGQNSEIAEDLTSEIFLKAMKHFDAYDPAGGAAWIFTIARNHVINHWRDTHGRETDIEEIEDNIVFSKDGFEAFARAAGAEELAAHLRALSPEKRRLVTMKHLEGYSYDELSKILGKEVGALKVAAHRALKELKLRIMNQGLNAICCCFSNSIG